MPVPRHPPPRCQATRRQAWRRWLLELGRPTARAPVRHGRSAAARETACHPGHASQGPNPPLSSGAGSSNRESAQQASPTSRPCEIQGRRSSQSALAPARVCPQAGGSNRAPLMAATNAPERRQCQAPWRIEGSTRRVTTRRTSTFRRGMSLAERQERRCPWRRPKNRTAQPAWISEETQSRRDGEDTPHGGQAGRLAAACPCLGCMKQGYPPRPRRACCVVDTRKTRLSDRPNDQLARPRRPTQRA